MLALEISINGKKVALAGTEGASNICATVDALGEEIRSAVVGKGPVVLHLGGIGQERHFTWIKGKNCSIGDEITIRVVDASANEVQPPVAVEKIDRNLFRPTLIGKVLSFVFACSSMSALGATQYFGLSPVIAVCSVLTVR